MNFSQKSSILSILIFTILFSACKKDDDDTITPTPIPAPTTVKDIDGNVYSIIKIGDQYWMGENLRTKHYRNGDPVPHVTDDTQWSCTNTPAYCNYNNSGLYTDDYGCLYNWYAVSDGPLLAPEGWHIATEQDWEELENYLGGITVAGGKLKDTSSVYWLAPNLGATDLFNFSARAGGFRENSSGDFTSMGEKCMYWTSTEIVATGAACRILHHDDTTLGVIALHKGIAASVRCVKDSQ